MKRFIKQLLLMALIAAPASPADAPSLMLYREHVVFHLRVNAAHNLAIATLFVTYPDLYLYFRGRYDALAQAAFDMEFMFNFQ